MVFFEGVGDDPRSVRCQNEKNHTDKEEGHADGVIEFVFSNRVGEFL